MIPLIADDIAAIFRCLEGSWSLVRQIEPEGRFHGEAQFLPLDGGTLHYREEGVLEKDGREIAGYREFLYRLVGDRIVIDFADPQRFRQPYVSLSFDREGTAFVARAEHFCAPDRYVHEMGWHNADHFMTDIRVKGPAKDYRLITRYARRTDSGQT